MGVINAVGNTMGFIAPNVTGLITNHHNDVRHWQVGLKRCSHVMEYSLNPMKLKQYFRNCMYANYMSRYLVEK
jgi:hypothetical protein